MHTRTAQNISIIGFASGLGARDPGCADGPNTLRELDVFRGTILPVSWDRILHPTPPGASPVEAVAALCARLARAVHEQLSAGNFPLVAGGDHTCAIGTWSGVRHWQRGPLGLIWIDAHMDSHTFATSPSKALHGMPLACLLGHGEPALTELVSAGPKLRPEHVCLLGVRSYEPGEAALLEQLAVRIITMDEIRARGLKTCLSEALSIARGGTAGYGVSIDLDVLDPAEEPGVGSPAPGGLPRRDLEEALYLLRNDPKFVALEIAEYNPHRDRGGQTAKAAGMLLRAMLGTP